MTAKITIVPLNHPVLIRLPEQSDYENNKARIKRILKTKYKLNKFVFATGEWFNENDTEKSIVVKRFTDEKGYTNALLCGDFVILLSTHRTSCSSVSS